MNSRTDSRVSMAVERNDSSASATSISRTAPTTPSTIRNPMTSSPMKMPT
ncbi:MAG: hypothetical protein R2716_12005 [Microthrixaceae bacterium]